MSKRKSVHSGGLVVTYDPTRTIECSRHKQSGRLRPKLDILAAWVEEAELDMEPR